MYNPQQQHFVFKNSNGRVITLYYDEKLGLCQSSLTRRGTWAEPVSLQKNIFPVFAADIGFEDTLHVLFQDRQGNIHYSRIKEENAASFPILSSKHPTAYDKHFSLVPFKNITHLFFVLKHDNRFLLSHQTFAEGNASVPKVIDYVYEHPCPFSIAHDREGNLYAFYPSSDGQYLQMGFKRFTVAFKSWGEFTPVSRYKGNCEYPKALADAANILHICYQRRSGNQYELVYQQKVAEKNIWSEEAVIHTSGYPFVHASIVCTEEDIIIFWIREEGIVYSMSKDRGQHWSKPSRLSFTSGRQLFCLSYHTNSPQEKDRIIAKEIPGNFINGLRLAFYQFSAGNNENLSAEELKNLLLDSLKLIKSNIEELQEAQEKEGEAIRNLQLSQQTLEREITKNSVRMDVLGRGLAELKGLESRIDTLQAVVIEWNGKMQKD